MKHYLHGLDIRTEQDVMTSQQRSRLIAELLGFDAHERTRIGTAVSEIARNAFRYAGSGRLQFEVTAEAHPRLCITVSDQGPGIKNLQAVLDGATGSKNGPGFGHLGAKRLMSHLAIESDPSIGTRVYLEKNLAFREMPVTQAEAGRIREAIDVRKGNNALNELQFQNLELVWLLDELTQRQDELRQQQQSLAHLNRELEDTNRGVIALNAELEDKAQVVKEASEAKGRFLSHITHEIRTPVNSILSLTRILLTAGKEPLSSEQTKQISFIRKAAEHLSQMVNDLLDKAKLEAGRLTVQPDELEIGELFGALRAMFKPLMNPETPVELIFDDEDTRGIIFTDEGKLAQILRNLVSNALKYTEKGHVKVSSRFLSSDWIEFRVEDTGIGIQNHDQERIFEEFIQVDGPLQKKAKGTGLGLPLAKKLCALLGGQLLLQSTFGQGTTFLVRLPTRYGASSASRPDDKASNSGEDKPSVLIIDDDEISRYIIKDLIRPFPCRVLEVDNGEEGLAMVAKLQPCVIFLDLKMPKMSGYQVMERLDQLEGAKDIPVIVHSSTEVQLKDVASAGRPIEVLSKGLTNREEALFLIERMFRDGVGKRIQGAPRG